VIGHASGHGGGNARRFMDAAKVVVHVVQRDRQRVIFQIFAECVCEPIRVRFCGSAKLVETFCPLQSGPAAQDLTRYASHGGQRDGPCMVARGIG
jgi:hypothetical protein